MRLGIFAKTFSGASPRPVLAAARQAGFEAVQYNMACSGLSSLPEHIPAGSAEAIRAAADATGVAVVAISATYNMIHPDPAVRNRGHESLDRIAEAARGIGSPLLTLCTGTRDPDDQWRHHRDNNTREAWRDLLSSMETAIGIAERHNVDLGVEPELANVIDSAARARRLIDEMASLRLKIVFDPANLFETAPLLRQRAIVAESVALLADRIAIAHAKDRDAHGNFVSAGHGVLDYTFYLEKLREIGFDGPLVAHGLAEAEAPDVARFLSARLCGLERTS